MSTATIAKPTKEQTTKEQTTKEQFNCPICDDTYTLNARHRKIVCYGCNYGTCNHCQHRYAKMTCMNCHSPFSKVQVESLLGKQFVKDTVIAGEIAELVASEKALIPATAVLVKYLDERKAHKTMLAAKGQLEFGETTNKDVWDDRRPIIRGKNWANIYCNVPNCPGMLCLQKINTKKFDCDIYNNGSYNCNVCKTNYCVKCLDRCSSNKTHVCDPNNAQTISAIALSTRPCPRCSVRITKTHGCDHMHCTHCDAHFSWKTLKLTKSSSNYHYRAFMATRQRTEQPIVPEDDAPEDRAPEDIRHPKIPEDVLSPHIPEKIHHVLYVQANKIRKYFVVNCAEFKITNEYNIKCDDLRVLFMTNKLDETAWGRMLYQYHKTMRMKTMHRDIIQMYLGEIDRYQSLIYARTQSLCEPITPTDIDKWYDELVEVITRCNSCFESVNNEFYCCKKETRYRFALPGEMDAVVLMQHNVINNIGDPETYEPEEESEQNQDQVSEKEKPRIIKQIEILNHQVDHYALTCKILRTNPYMLDLSRPGGGKTYNALKYAQTHRFDHTYSVCPATVRDKKWLPTINEYGPTDVKVLSYQELCSKKMVQPKHGLLQRDDFTELQDEGRREVNIVQFEITEKFRNMLDSPNGVLFVFDEIQYIKKEDNAATRACRVIMTAIVESVIAGKPNRFICMSGTPIDEEVQFVTFFRNIGVQRTSQLFTYNPHTHTNTPTGYKDIIDYCNTITNRAHFMYTRESEKKAEAMTQTVANYVADMEIHTNTLNLLQTTLNGLVNQTKQDEASNKEMELLVDQINTTSNKINTIRDLLTQTNLDQQKLRNEIIYQDNVYHDAISAIRAASHPNIQRAVTARDHIAKLFVRAFKPFISSKMHIPDSPFRVININTFYRLDAESTVLCKRAIENMVQIVDSTDGSIHGEARINLFAAMHMLEISHVNVMVGEALLKLQENTTNKVVLVINYSESINRLQRALSVYSPLLLSGETTSRERARRIDLFQEPNSNHRLIIANLGVMCCGIDLDDKDGRFPRHVMVIPTFKTISMYQMSLRFLRSVDTKSNTTIRYIYSIQSVVLDSDTIVCDSSTHNCNNKNKTVSLTKLKNTPMTVSEYNKNMYINIEKQLGITAQDVKTKTKPLNQEMRVLSILDKKSNILRSISEESDEVYACGFACQITV